jgi:hypothetical protein
MLDCHGLKTTQKKWTSDADDTVEAFPIARIWPDLDFFGIVKIVSPARKWSFLQLQR